MGAIEARLDADLRAAGIDIAAFIAAVHRICTSGDVPSPKVALSRSQSRLLKAHSGVSADEVDAAARRAPERAAALATAEAVRTTRAWKANEVAARLGKHRSTVSRLKTTGGLYALPGPDGERYPWWQFYEDPDGGKMRVVPHLADVLALLPAPAHPATVEYFFTTARPHYTVDGHEMNVVEWLVSAGDVEHVADEARSLNVLG